MAKPRDMKADTLRSVAAASVTASYANLGDSLTQNWVIVTMKNTTDKTLFVSENASDDHYEIPSGGTEVLDLQANARGKAWAHKAKGMQLSVKGVTGDLPTTGKIILQGQYV